MDIVAFVEKMCEATFYIKSNFEQLFEIWATFEQCFYSIFEQLLRIFLSRICLARPNEDMV